jgi:phosphoglycolate phosphatase
MKFKSNLALTHPQLKRLLAIAERKENIIWDWNGTLLNDVDYVVGVINPLLEKHGLKKQTQESYKSIFGFPVQEYYIKMGFDLEKNCFSKLSDDFHDSYYSNFFSCDLYDVSQAALVQFKTAGKSQSILSASDQQSLYHVIDHYRLKPFFDHVFGIENKLAISKLKRGQELMDQSGYFADQTLLIGDTDHDLEVGRNLGLEVVLVSHGHQSKDRLLKIHDQVI